MHYWRGVITHASFLLAQPVYLAVRYMLEPADFASRSSINSLLHGLAWLYIATQISVPFFTNPLRRLPSPPGEKFLLGHLNFNGGKPFTSIFEDMINETPNDGILVLWGPLYLNYEIMVTQPKTIMDVLNSHNYDWEKPNMIRKALNSMLGEGLVNVEGAKHKAMRRVVAPAFSGRQIRDLTPLFCASGTALTDAIAHQTRNENDGIVEVAALISRVTLDIIGAAGVGMNFRALENEESTLAKLYESISQPPAFFLLVDTFVPKWLVRRVQWGGFRRTIEAQSQLWQEVRDILQQKKRHMNQEKHSKDIIAHIMQSGDFSDDYLISQLLTFLAAGHATTASALVWALWLLSLHPEMQERLRTECRATLAGHHISQEADASIYDAENTPFLTAVCDETLRLYPPAPNTVRQAVVPTTVGSVAIAKGTAVSIPPWAINRSRVLWGANAAEFVPDRWLQGPNAATGGAQSPYAYLTFLHGPRSCIGQSFARLEMKCLLAPLITRFRFEPLHPGQTVEIAGFVTIKPLGGLRLRVHDLQGNTGS